MTPNSSVQPVHLLVCVHGMWGDPVHLDSLKARIQKQFPPDSVSSGEPMLDVLVASANRGNHTYDGVDWGAERVASEILDYIEKLEEDGSKRVTRFSMVGYSLGGLISRYVVGILYTHNFFDRIEPHQFFTFATPHIGLPRYPSFFSGLTTTLGPIFLSRTGEQFYGVDKWGATERPLLEVMSDPSAVFYQCLARFRRLEIYANAYNDITVPYVTAAIETSDPFFNHATNGLKIQFNPTYPHLIDSWSFAPKEPKEREPQAVFSLAYARSFLPSSPFLPPILHFRYPLNILFFILLPILLPVLAPFFITFIVYRFSSAARASRQRIRLLEEAEHRRPALVYRLGQSGSATPTEGALPLNGGDRLVPVDVPGSDGTYKENPKQAAIVAVAAADSVDNIDGPVPDANTIAAAAGEQPILTETQARCSRYLNTLPRLTKHLAAIDGVRNTHGPLICRAPTMTQGWDILEHWAEHFLL